MRTRKSLSIAERVAGGAELLDSINPEWWSKIVPDRLPEDGVLLQVFGSHTAGLKVAGVSPRDGVDYGFDLTHAEYQEEGKWVALGEAWMRAYVERARSHGHYQASAE